MAAVPVTITGVLADKYGRTIQSVTLFGEMVRSDVGVGGGPIFPPDSGAKPPWGGVDKPPMVEHPIWPPKWPGQGPIIPPDTPPPELPPDLPKPPPDFGLEWHVAWTPSTGWIVVAVPSGTHPVPSA